MTKEASDQAEAAMKLAPDSAEVHLLNGRVYYLNKDFGQLMRYDPKSGGASGGDSGGAGPQPIDGKLGLRAATQETPDGYIWCGTTDWLVRGKAVDGKVDLIDGYAFNGRGTIADKLAYTKKHKLAGVMIWEIGQDSSDPESSLLKVISDFKAGKN